MHCSRAAMPPWTQPADLTGSFDGSAVLVTALLSLFHPSPAYLSGPGCRQAKAGVQGADVPLGAALVRDRPSATLSLISINGSSSRSLTSARVL